MARIRSIKPEFFANEKLSALPTDTHLLAVALLCYADDEGYFNANPGLVRAQCLPLREDSRSVPVMLTELSNVGYLEFANSADGKSLGRVAKFLEHQVINKPTPSKIKRLWPISEYSRSTPVVVPDECGWEQGTGNRERNREQGVESPPVSNPEPVTPSEPPTPATKPVALKPIPPKPATTDESELEPIQCARGMFEHLAITAPPKTLNLASEAIRILASQLAMTPYRAMLVIRRRAEIAAQAGETVNAFWFEDSKWKSDEQGKPSVADRKNVGIYNSAYSVPKEEPEPEKAPEGADTELGQRIWQGINKALKSELPAGSWDLWIRPIKPLGALNGELYLQIPTPDFAHVGDRYDIAKFLPAGVTVVRLLSATGAAA